VVSHQGLTRPAENPRAPADSVRRLLEARSVAVVGASARPGSFGETAVRQLLEGGHEGPLWPVNPRYDEVLGHRCYRALADLPEPVDLVVLAVPNALLEQQLQAAADLGAASGVIFSSCYEPLRTGRTPLTERLARIAEAAEMTICGGNCMGFLNVARGLLVCGFTMPLPLRPGGITFISHSGSAFSAFAYNHRGLRFNLVVSTGQELNTTAADYLDYALDQPDTSVVGIFLETVRRPEPFVRALEKAAARDVPVVILKVGRARRAKELVTAHSGALAGEDGAYEALFRAYGAVRVRSLDEMADALELFATQRRAAPGGLAAVHDSGGERALLIDAAADVGVPLACISEETRSRLAAVLEDGLPPTNPLDAWGTGNDFEAIFERCIRALSDDPDTAAVAFSVDLTTQEEADTGYIRVAKRAFESTSKPMAVLSNLSAAIDPRDAGSLRASGVPVLEGTYTGLAAFKHLLAYRDARARPAPQRAAAPPQAVVTAWRRRLTHGGPMGELEGLRLLRDFGIPTVDASVAASAPEATAAGRALGWPVVMKTAAPGVQHKSDVGGVRLGIRNERELADAYADLSQRLGPEVIVEATAPRGVELALGIVRDAQFGPLVMVASGGIFIELSRDQSWGLPPLDHVRARALIDSLSSRALLSGARGAPAADVDAVAGVVVRVSVLAETLGDLVDAIDVNPLVAASDRCVAVDALVVARYGATSRAPGGEHE
jgi:acyl-CoA synthetase (NDP forming)